MNTNSNMEVSSGIVPLNVKMLNQITLEGNQVYYDNVNLTIVCVHGRFQKVVKEQNQVRYSISINDDTGILKVTYFANKQNEDPILKLIDDGKDDPSFYYKFIISIKVFKDAPYFVLQHYLASNISDWMYHTMKVIEVEVQSRPPVDWKSLKDEPLEIQIEGYIRHNKRANIGQLLKKFNCSLQQLKVLIDQLKKRSAIAECLNKETFRIVN
ncbi:unnamed protein product [Paramecium octaurelia]|uniref:Uncharacterized protein n=1 Tax=Paramecium octaurelia TaxID=43137 RepID=A0A8S1Y1N4_PAROT|nr:unnamed protein product [Paramecium octaurelia]